MKHTISIIASMLFLCIADVWAQNAQYLEKLDKILTGSVDDRSMRTRFTSDSIGYRRGLNPVDPKFEIAYFFENRFEANLTVDLDMPSLYHQRNVLSKLNTSRSKAIYRKDRMDILAEISDCYLELIYNSQLKSLLESIIPRDSIEFYRQNTQKAFDRGDITALNYADMQMTLATLCDAVMETERQIDFLSRNIKKYNPDFILEKSEYPYFDFSDMTMEDFVQQALSRNPISDIKENDSLIYERQLKLAKWEWAPKFIIGARLDMNENRNFAPAAIAGISIPLWENRGNIRHAKAQMAYGAIESEKREQEFRTQLEQLYKRYSTADNMISNWIGYDMSYHCQKLFKAYNTGVITASELYFEFSHVVENATRFMQLQLEKASCAARMTLLLNGNDI